MKQIKTIISAHVSMMLPPGRMSTMEAFDAAVNLAIEEGWTLIRRDTIEGRLKAELERDI